MNLKHLNAIQKVVSGYPIRKRTLKRLPFVGYVCSELPCSIFITAQQHNGGTHGGYNVLHRYISRWGIQYSQSTNHENTICWCKMDSQVSHPEPKMSSKWDVLICSMNNLIVGLDNATIALCKRNSEHVCDTGDVVKHYPFNLNYTEASKFTDLPMGTYVLFPLWVIHLLLNSSRNPRSTRLQQLRFPPMLWDMLYRSIFVKKMVHIHSCAGCLCHSIGGNFEYCWL